MTHAGQASRKIVEERIYTLEMGAAAQYLRLYEEHGLAVQTRYLPRMLGYFFTEAGPLNQIVHLWAYESFDQRLACRAAMAADPAWRDYVDKIRPLVRHQESKILRPAAFSPIR